MVFMCEAKNEIFYVSSMRPLVKKMALPIFFFFFFFFHDLDFFFDSPKFIPSHKGTFLYHFVIFSYNSIAKF